MNIFTQFFKKSNEHERRQQITQDVIRLEASVTKDIFGPIPAGVKRDFFCLDRSTWIWYEEWIDENGQTHQLTTRYIIRPNEVLKSQNGGAYYRLSREEFKNFKHAAEKYYSTIKAELYQDFKEPAVA